jgi:hypothetical protein
MTLTPILLVANFIVALLLVLVVGYMWRLMASLSVVATYTTLYLNDKYGDFGNKQFEEME